jgi:SNF2 family DNA or RNA helicase|tara:strand:- start:1182 stop:2717 length:1536 start_codon:yes stop_codon:yes gene_type:complete
MRVIDNRAILLNLRDPEKVTDIIPKSKRLSGNKVLVNWGVDESHVLKNLNIKVPSPIEGQYKWTGKHKPFDHQKTTSSFLTMNKRAFCFNEQGTGKTASAIWAADYLMNQGRINRVLVICPLSIMDSAWRKDLFTFAMHRSVDIAYGSSDKRKQIIEGGAEFIVINYDGVEIVADAIANGGFDLIIADEATHYKNVQTRRWKVLNKLVTPNTWLWMMTGTPAAQSPLDAFGLAKLINPNSVPRFFSAFRDMVMYKITNFKWLPRPDATDTVFKSLQPAIRFTKEECLDLPDMIYTKRTVEMTRQQKKYYNELKNKLVVQAGGERITAVNAAVEMNKLLQIASGAIYTDDGEALEFDIKHRYKVLREVIDESSKKVLVFVPFKHVIDVLTNKLIQDGIPTEIIRGDVSVNKRTDIFKRFQETDSPQVLVIQPQAAAHGITLTAANTVVWWGPTSSLETYAQANARVHRAGQDHKCTVVQLEGSFIEKRVYSLLDNRIDVHTKMIDLYKEILV